MRDKDRRWGNKGGGNCGTNCERRSRLGKHVLCDAISMVTSRPASRAAHAPLHAPDDAPSSMMTVDRSVLEARLAEDHQGWSLRRPVREKVASFFCVEEF